MWKNIVSKIWRNVPGYLKYRAVRATQRKFTVSAGAVVFNEGGEILLLDHLLRPGSGWGIPGGFINPSEQLEDAVRREIFEETGLRLSNLELISIRTIYRHIEAMFCADGIGEAEVKSFEIKEVKWFPVDKLPSEISASQLEIIQKALSKWSN